MIARPLLRPPAVLLLALLTWVTFHGSHRAVGDERAEPVSIEVASGRRFTAEVDPRTDETHVWLRWQSPFGYVMRPVRWDRIRSVQVGPGALSADEFRRRVGQWAVPMPEREPNGAEDAIQLRPPERQPTVHPAREPAPKVRSLDVEAEVANWDADPEVDGLVVMVMPRDGSWGLVPVSGTLEVQLIAERTGVVKPSDPWARQGRWVCQVHEDDFDVHDAGYHFPFQAFHPELDPDWADYGTVIVKLTVPGQGVFEATDAAFVRLQPYSAIRDRLEQHTDRRFFDLERTGRTR